MAGWIKIHREIQQHWIAQDMEKFGWWVDMLLLASYEDNKAFVGRHLLDVKRGSFVAGTRFLASRWRTSKDKVNAFLNLLVQDGMITRETSKNTTLVTICNYESYQENQESVETPLRHPCDTSATPLRQTKEIKEIKEINNNNLNARTREERVPWEKEREASLKAAFKANGSAMALSRESGLNAQTIYEYLERFMDACQIGDRGHRDIGHFGNDFRKFALDPRNKPNPQKKKVTSNADLFKEMYNV